MEGWKPGNLSCSIPPPSHLDTKEHLLEPSSSPQAPTFLLPPPAAPHLGFGVPKGKGKLPPCSHLGSTGGGGGRGGHGGAAVVALAGTGAGSGRGGCSGGGFGSAAPRPERGHPLRGSLGQDELLPQLQVGPSSCCRGERKENSALEGLTILIRAQEAPGLGAASLGISPSPSLRAARFSCSA